jgi:hypothetical protein
MTGEQPLFDGWAPSLVRHPALWPPADDSVMSPYDAAHELGWMPLFDEDEYPVAFAAHLAAGITWDVDEDWGAYGDAW